MHVPRIAEGEVASVTGRVTLARSRADPFAVS